MARALGAGKSFGTVKYGWTKMTGKREPHGWKVDAGTWTAQIALHSSSVFHNAEGDWGFSVFDDHGRLVFPHRDYDYDATRRGYVAIAPEGAKAKNVLDEGTTWLMSALMGIADEALGGPR